MHRKLQLIALLSALTVAGCARLGPRGTPAVSAAATAAVGADEAVRAVFGAAGETVEQADPVTPAPAPASSFTLAQVLAVANRHHPTFAEFEASREAARAEVIQARAYPNPELELSLGAEPGLGLGQRLESPAKRRTRRAAAELSEEIVRRESEVFRATLRAEVGKAYHTVRYYERAVALAAETRRIAEEIEKIVVRRVDGGVAPEIDRIKAHVETLRASRVVQAQQRTLRTWRAVLNALCGRSLPAGFALSDPLASRFDAANAARARELALSRHPSLRRLEGVVRQKQLIVAREEKAWYPDLTPGVSLGAGLGALLGVELPLWYRNRGGIAAAKADGRKAEAELARARQEVERDLETGIQAYESAREQLAAFEGGLRGAAAESLQIETHLYEQGEAEFLQLLDARRTAQQTEAEYLQALYDANVARVELERAIGIGGDEQ